MARGQTKLDPTIRGYSSAVAVERAADILFLVAEAGEISLTDLARAIGSSGSAVHRILTALKKKGLLVQSDNGRYSLSWSILGLTRRLLAEGGLREFALPLMIELRDLSEETVTLNIRSGFERVCIDAVEGLHEVRWRQEIGRISPLFVGSTGRVFLAFLPEGEIDSYFRTVKPKKLTPQTVVDPQRIRRELGAIRMRGYAMNTQDHYAGVAAVSVPIRDREDGVSAALTIAGPAERCTKRRMEAWVQPLTDRAEQISQLLNLQSARPGVSDGATA